MDGSFRTRPYYSQFINDNNSYHNHTMSAEETVELKKTAAPAAEAQAVKEPEKGLSEDACVLPMVEGARLS